MRGAPSRAPGRTVSANRGIFGGSFDPVHVGHLTVARAVADLLQLDLLHLIPAHAQPLKPGGPVASGADRLAMLQLAAAEDDRLLVDDREIRRGGTSYTIDTLREMAGEFPDDRLSLMIGADAARELDQWKDGQAVASLARIVVLTRPGVPVPRHPFIDRTVEVPAVPVSATAVRERIRSGESIAGLVPERVATYIASHRLYLVEA